MSEKQLTVAELLARSGKKPADSSRRRRRHSVEEGGISVAELTGNIPKVEAKPASGKHNSDSIDNPDAPKPVSTPKPAERAEKPAAEKTEQVEKKADASAPAASKSYATPASAKPEIKATEEKTPEAKPETKPAAKAEPKSEVKAPEAAKPAEAKKPEPAKVETEAKAPAKPEVKRAQPGAKEATPATDETVVLSVVDEKDPVRLTTGTFPAVSKEQADKAAAKEEKPAEKKPLTPAEQAAKAKADAEAKKTEESKDSGKGKAAAAGVAGAGAAVAGGAAVKDSEKTNIIPAITDEDLAKVKNADEDLTEEELAAEHDAEEEFADEDVEYVDADEDAEYDEEEWDEEYDEDEEWDEDESVSVPAIIGMAIAGILLGVLVFKGFEMLWGSLNKGIVTVLAVAVTAVMVGVIHALRTNRDRLSMVLAVVVGLIMTFGPLLTIS